MTKEKKSTEESKTETPKGRPSKYKEEYCDLLVKHMASGMTFESFAGHPEVCVNRDTIYEWCKFYEEFSEAKKVGRSCQLYKDEQTLEMLTSGTLGEKANATPHIFKMKNCHGWKDKSEVANTNTEMSYEQYLKTLGEN